MKDDDPDARRQARTVEIGTAVVLAVLIAVVPGVVLWLVLLVTGVDGPDWLSTRQALWRASLVVGVAVAVWWLLRARRRGL